ncbi:glycosyltransferase [Hymenobacter radiodurans]|uniref:glycosyltransferase n=1 Tax=Hymenobacter radiodurans TaxID=2496028 RepID=UPI001058467C|nr:glycosyltransferase [Hymenobacter radiodurans]
MQLVFFTHPDFIKSQSMPRFARMLAEGMRERGHKVEIWSSPPRLCRLSGPSTLKKWLGYIDQYILFPSQIQRRIKLCSPHTLFVFTDQALGPWVPLVHDRPHIIHCHDFLAQQSAKGQIQENPTSWTGRLYQSFIQWGYSKGKYFISVSEKTQHDLHHFLPELPLYSTVVYNGLNWNYTPLEPRKARHLVGAAMGLNLASGYLLHVGGNLFYKNRIGVIELYNAWRLQGGAALPLLLIGEQPSPQLLQAQIQSPYKKSIYFISSVPDELVQLAYTGALVLLFPSLAEGFGWPIAEAMASGCPVITTGEAPMTEVGGTVAFYLPRRPATDNATTWAQDGATLIEQVVTLPPRERAQVVAAGLTNAGRFETNKALNRIEEIYQSILPTFPSE